MTKATVKSNGAAEPYVLFELGQCTYGVASRELEHMEMVGTITPVPDAAPFVAGITFSRGRVVPVIDLRRRFGLELMAPTLRARLIVVRDDGRTVGLIVDQASRFVALAPEAIQPLPPGLGEAGAGFLRGIATVDGRMVLMIDVGKVLAPSRTELRAAAESENTSRESGARHGHA